VESPGGDFYFIFILQCFDPPLQFLDVQQYLPTLGIKTVPRLETFE
jgi:hypothetical protein